MMFPPVFFSLQTEKKMWASARWDEGAGKCTVMTISLLGVDQVEKVVRSRK